MRYYKIIDPKLLAALGLAPTKIKIYNALLRFGEIRADKLEDAVRSYSGEDTNSKTLRTAFIEMREKGLIDYEFRGLEGGFFMPNVEKLEKLLESRRDKLRRLEEELSNLELTKN